MHKTDLTHRPPRTWYKLVVSSPNAQAENIAAFLSTISENGIEQSVCLDQIQHQTEIITAYIENDDNRNQKMSRLHSFLEEINQNLDQTSLVTFKEEYIVEQDWNSEWKKYFEPFNLTQRLVVKPSWSEYSAKKDELILELDPGMAFGTGLHDSTKLALLLIEKLYSSSEKPSTVLDIGTGTGILGMSCALFGAQKVIGLDNDIDARVAANENITKNSLHRIMNILDDDLHEITGCYDLVIANITHDILISLSKDILDKTATKGKLVLSGILKENQAANIKKIFTGLGFSLVDSMISGEWEAICFQKSINS